ncbi:MAG TPA: hypothetical protein VG295_01615 [Solirubrobacteraceae bacterium]|nr:hypothetical protein [Solirubrobacteraceae bacterium]
MKGERLVGGEGGKPGGARAVAHQRPERQGAGRCGDLLVGDAEEDDVGIAYRRAAAERACDRVPGVRQRGGERAAKTTRADDG